MKNILNNLQNVKKNNKNVLNCKKTHLFLQNNLLFEMGKRNNMKNHLNRFIWFV